MKLCEVISGFYMKQTIGGEEKTVPVNPGSGPVELPDDVADDYYRQGLVDIISHDGQPVGYGPCCGGH